jgi:hypothetical protein
MNAWISENRKYLCSIAMEMMIRRSMQYYAINNV